MGLSDPNELVREAWIQGLEPDPELTVSEWADQHRVLSPVASREAGPWRTSRTPYLREIMDSLSAHSPVRTVVLLKGAQVGGTEVVLNWLGYTVDVSPAPMLAVQPTVELAQRFSKQRLDSMAADSPTLAGKLGDRKSRDGSNTTLLKVYPGGLLALVGANSGAGLRSMPAARCALDEVDAYPGDVEGEGDPVELASRALRSYGKRSKRLLVSTPTIAGRSRIEREYLLGDQREFHVPCPECGHLQTIAWPRIRWEDDDLDTVWLECLECQARIYEHQKPAIMAAGVWIPGVPERSDTVRSYKLPGLYAPLGMYSWADSVRKFTKGKTDAGVLRVWTNHDLAETWAEKGELPDWELMYQRREDYPLGTVPEGGLVLTAGVDVQKDRLELEVVAWGEGLQSWTIDYTVLTGDTAQPEVWNDLHRLLDHPWPSAHGVDLRIERMAVDTGFQTQTVYRWVRGQQPRRVMAVKGDDRPGVLLSTPKAVEVTVQGHKARRGVQLWTVGTGLAKEELYGWLRQRGPLEDGDPYPHGWVHLPQLDPGWFKMLCSEQLVARVVAGSRRYVWEKVTERNEALDCRVYARAAAAALGLDRWGTSEWDRQRSALANRARPVSGAGPAATKPEDDFLGRWSD